MEAEGKPSATCAEPFGAFPAKDLPSPHHLTVFTYASPATLADAHGFNVAVFVATHGASPDLFCGVAYTENFAALKAGWLISPVQFIAIEAKVCDGFTGPLPHKPNFA